jgi:hypothetical protein
MSWNVPHIATSTLRRPHTPPTTNATMIALTLATTATASTPPPISVAYSHVVDMHISEIMPVFLSDALNSEWSPTLESHMQVYTREHGMLAHQRYKLPWPLASREVLLSCERKSNARDATMTSACHSVAHDSIPIRDDVVRMELSNTAWKIEALADERTRLSLTLDMPGSVAIGVPKQVVSYCQKRALRDSVTNLIAAVERLGLPPHQDYVRWKRSRAALAAMRGSSAASSVLPASTLLAWLAELASSSAAATAVGLIAMLLAGHALAFALLARVWRGRPRRGATSGAAGAAPLVPEGRPASPISVLPGGEPALVEKAPQ